MSSVNEKNYSESSGVISVMRQVGMMRSIAVVMCMIAFTMGTGTQIPEMKEEFITALKYTFSVCFVMAVAGALMTWFSKERT